jgi:hypothetical protein
VLLNSGLLTTEQMLHIGLKIHQEDAEALTGSVEHDPLANPVAAIEYLVRAYGQISTESSQRVLTFTEEAVMVSNALRLTSLTEAVSTDVIH